jgi:hypothetical protein
MKLKVLSLAALLSFGLSVPVIAADTQTSEMPKTPEAIAATMWDFTRNTEYLKDPKKFVAWMNAALEPSFYTSLIMQSLDPGMWATMANSMMHPGAYSAWTPLITDPNLYMKWLTATTDPNFYNAVLGQFNDPGKLMRWATAPADPKTVNLLLQPLNPNVYVKWLTAPLDPRTLQAMITPVNPNAYMGWLGATLNPASYGDLWKGFLNPPLPSPTAYAPGTLGYGTFAIPGLPVLSQPANGTQPYSYNPLDPNAWAKLWQVPGQAAPAGQPVK